MPVQRRGLNNLKEESLMQGTARRQPKVVKIRTHRYLWHIIVSLGTRHPLHDQPGACWQLAQCACPCTQDPGQRLHAWNAPRSLSCVALSHTFVSVLPLFDHRWTAGIHVLSVYSYISHVALSPMCWPLLGRASVHHVRVHGVALYCLRSQSEYPDSFQVLTNNNHRKVVLLESSPCTILSVLDGSS
jgi:hypothetical protein